MKNPSYGVSNWPYWETGMRGFGSYSCGGLFVFIMSTIDRKEMELYFEKALSLVSSGAYEEAIEVLNGMVKIDPGNIVSLDLKAFILNELGKYQEATEICDAVLKIDSKNVSSLNSKGFSLFSLGKYEDTVGVCHEVLKIDPNNEQAINNREAALEKLGIRIVQGQESMKIIDSFEDQLKNMDVGNLASKEEIIDKEAVVELAPAFLSENQESFWYFLTRKFFWVTLGVLYLIWLAYDMGKNESHVLTPQEIQSSISDCKRMGGKVVYDKDGEYYDCAINGRLE